MNDDRGAAMKSLTATGVIRSINVGVASCPVCYEAYDDPRLLSCAHTFCLRCLRLYYERLQTPDEDNPYPELGVMTCPVCRQGYRVESIDMLDELPRNLAAAQLIDVLKDAPPPRQKPNDRTVENQHQRTDEPAVDNNHELDWQMVLDVEEQEARDLDLVLRLSFEEQSRHYVEPRGQHEQDYLQSTNAVDVDEDYLLAVQLYEEEQTVAALLLQLCESDDDERSIAVGAHQYRVPDTGTAVTVVNQPSQSTIPDSQVNGNMSFSGRAKYSYEVLCRTDNLPRDVDLTHKEKHLTSDEFKKIFNMSYDNFASLPAWKQLQLKKDRQLW